MKENRMKKILSLIIIMSILLSFSAQSLASTYEIPERENSPMYIHLMVLSASLKISNLGVATCGADMTQNLETGSCELIMTLQKLNSDDSWSNVYSWSKTGERSCIDSKLRAVSRGTYRLFVTGIVYDSDGDFVEAGTIYSLKKIY
jgi:hypothetical protein